MQTRKFTDIDVANLVTGQYYRLEEIDHKDTLLIVADEGRREYYKVDIRFLHTEYIGCPTNFSNEFSFRLATEQEAAPIREYVGGTETRKVPVYCIERGISFSQSISDASIQERKAQNSLLQHGQWKLPCITMGILRLF